MAQKQKVSAAKSASSSAEVTPKTPASPFATYSKYAIFQTGGKQYQGIEGKTIAVEKLEGEPGAIIEFSEVLLRKLDENKVEIGRPYLKIPVKASIVKHDLGPKLVIFKFKRRKKSRTKKGHRQPRTIIRIESI